MTVVDRSLPGLVVVRLTRPDAEPVIVFGVYWRAGVDRRAETLRCAETIKIKMRLLKDAYPGELVFLGGDFNSRTPT